MKIIKILILTFFIGSLSFLISCKNEDPTPENIPELITKVILKFTPTGGGTAVTVTATDPDGEGSQDLQIDGPINLSKGTTYTLTIELLNGLYNPGADGYDVGKEVLAEGDEHQLFFSWTSTFSSPTGSGNIGSAPGVVNYQDEDINGLPIGLTTSWTTGADAESGKTFRVLLKHQPDIKSNTTTSLDGESDLDISFSSLNVN
ncbi:MAG TPA: hypothetical protein PKJ83_02250 [Cyclobacteriaceae bacterium]|nr:hypothetical protein [Cyclobacteriaceae bacterium]HPW62295.1 hypothetical protein [Cyclobacteriaceae bacterium]